MAKKLLIDFNKLRSMKDFPAEGILKTDNYTLSFKSIRELATFMFTCRHCEQAPCIDSCPVNALEKNPEGVITRAMLKCIRCKSCIVICPFGTMMDDLFAVRNSGRKFISVRNGNDLQDFAACFPADVVSLVDMDEDPANHIFRLSDDILVSEFTWE
ncbi:MAG: 4Fe-4S dicluster domain-containing protein [Bacteroidales bacterium]|nr:4Fe-4S dicluster domain-containing protein [Bacteroidales bacterium]